MPLSLFQNESFRGRFEDIRELAEDPAFAQGIALDRAAGEEIFWQLIPVPAIEEDEKIRLQFNSRAGIRHPHISHAREFLTSSSGGILILERPPGRFFSKIRETLRDEVYLEWLGQALEILAHLHSRGWLHLAQNEFSWLVEPFHLLDLGLFPEFPLGRRVHPAALVAVSPELWAGEPVDARADLYGLAALFLRQRSAASFQKFGTPEKLLDLHRGGRMADLVPKTSSRLNDLLRKMLQAKPLDRPASALDCLRELRQEEIPSPPGEPSPWLEARNRRRQVTLILSMIHTLLLEGKWETAERWLEEIRPRLSPTHGIYLDYLDAYLNRHLRPGEIKVRPWEGPKPTDPQLKVLIRIERADWERRNRQLDFSRNILDDILPEALNHPDPELAARVYLKRARLKRDRGEVGEAMEDLFEAWQRTRAAPGGRLRESLCVDWAELFLEQGLPKAAWALLSEVLLLQEGKVDPRNQILSGLALMKLERYEEAARFFYEGKAGFSAQKRLKDLIWAASHEIRLFLSQGDFPRSRREFRVLAARAKDHPEFSDWLDLVNILVWMEGGEWLGQETERDAERILQNPRLSEFQEAAWGRADSCALLGRAARRMGREDLFESFSRLAEGHRSALAPVLEKYSLMDWKAPSDQPAPSPEAVAQLAESAARAAVGGGPEFQQIQVELVAARERIRALEEEVRMLREGGAPPPRISPSTPRKTPIPPTPLPPTKGESERGALEAALRRHLGNREKAAKDLGINRRTLFAKLEKYGLKDASFLPTREEVLATIQACGGKKNDAAHRLGMTRSTFYRFLKELGIS